jgi:hypothetical protein
MSKRFTRRLGVGTGKGRVLRCLAVVVRGDELIQDLCREVYDIEVSVVSVS